MRAISHALVWVAVTFAGNAFAQTDRMASPPEPWAAYFATVRKADTIADAEQRCLAYPDMPGNAWHAGTAKARCALLRKPRYSLQDFEPLLAQPQGAATLEQHFRSLLDAHFADLAQREQIFVALDIFDGSALARRVADRWLDVAPDSAFARVASGKQYVIAAWDARGGKWARKTERENFQRMHELLARALPELDKALAANPKLLPACHAMLQISQVGSDGELAQRALAHCLKIDDSDYFVVQRWQWIVQPKWGGSIEALRETDAYVGARVDKVPLLGVQLGSAPLYEAYMLAADEEWAKALPKLESAVTLAPEAYYLRWTGDAARYTGDQWKALAYLTQSLRFSPNDEDTRELRALTRITLGDFTGAIADAEVALKKEPANGSYAFRLADAHKYLHHTEAARAAYRIARDDPATHQAGFERWCESFFFAQSDLPQAEACTADLVKEFPQYGQAWYMRLWILDKMKDKRAFEAVNQFLKYADMRNSEHKRIVDMVQADPVKWGVKP